MLKSFRRLWAAQIKNVHTNAEIDKQQTLCRRYLQVVGYLYCKLLPVLESSEIIKL